jgi:hypothetical protein
MKTAVSIPDRVFQSAEMLAARLGVSRSQLYARALAALVEQHSEDAITSKLNEVYGKDGAESSLDKELVALQSGSVSREKWSIGLRAARKRGQRMSILSAEDQRALDALREAVAEALERKRRLGQYAVIWRDGRVVRIEPEEKLMPSSRRSRRQVWD